MTATTSETSKRARYWLTKSAVAAEVAKNCISAASLNPHFKESADYFTDRALYFLALGLAEMALRPIPPLGAARN